MGVCMAAYAASQWDLVLPSVISSNEMAIARGDLAYGKDREWSHVRQCLRGTIDSASMRLLVSLIVGIAGLALAFVCRP